MHLSKENNPFAILGLDAKPTDKEVRLAYRRLAMKYHPDRNASEDAEEQFKRIQQAYQLIKDTGSRQQVRDILDMYNYRGDEPVAPPYQPSSTTSGPKPLFVLSAYLAELRLEVKMAMRIKRLPLKLAVFFTALLILHGYLRIEDSISKIIGVSFVQAAMSAFAIDLILQMSLRYHRYYLRRIVDRFVVCSVLLSTVGLVYGNSNLVPIHWKSITVDPELVVSGSILLLAMAAYAWLVFSFLFQKHSPFWEVLLVSFGVGTVTYFSLLVIF